MGDKPELQTLKQVCRRLVKTKKAESEDINLLHATFGLRFERAWEATENRRVKKYIFRPSKRVVWIVVGKGRDYLMMPEVDFCTCDDFYFRVMDNQVHLCYHLISQKLAEALRYYDLYEEEDGLYDALMKEWKKG